MQLETRYALSGEVHIAYQVVGRGPDLLFVPGLISHLDLDWEDTAYRSFIRQLSRVARVTRYDKRGNGLSDPVSEVPTVEDRCADAFAVLDAIGATSAVIFGHCEGGPIAVRMAVQRPDLVRGLVLYGTGGRSAPPAVISRFRQTITDWGSGATLDLFAPSQAGDPIARQARGRLERAAASPALAQATFEALGDSDVQDVLPEVRAATLVVHRREEMVPIAEAHLLADRIDDARLVELDGCDHLPWLGETGPLLDAVSAFMAEFDGGATTRASRPGPIRRSRAGITGLTASELGVAELVGQGLSNPEIARHLFISRHTVETHLKHIFLKLGIDSRAKLAELVHAVAARNP